MTKNEIIDIVATRTGINKAITWTVVNEMIATMTTAIADGDKVVLQGFGTLRMHRKATDGAIGRDSVTISFTKGNELNRRIEAHRDRSTHHTRTHPAAQEGR